MVRLLSFSAKGHDVMELNHSDAVEEARRFVETYKGRIVSTSSNKFIKPEQIREDEEVLFLSQLQGG